MTADIQHMALHPVSFKVMLFPTLYTVMQKIGKIICGISAGGKIVHPHQGLRLMLVFTVDESVHFL